jgi:TRAP-type C4-dicarboxylate transport system permease large subunit
MTMSIQKKFMTATIGLILALILITVIVTIILEQQNIRKEADSEVNHQTAQTVRLLTVTDSLMRQQVEASMQVLMDRIAQLGPVAQGVIPPKNNRSQK